MFLIEQLLASQECPRLVVAHVQHVGFRENTTKDADFVESYCESHHLTFEKKVINMAEAKSTHKTSFENAAREERRLFFEELLRKYGASYIVTGHHLDDQIETLIYRMAR